jgi:hypothetical protein
MAVPLKGIFIYPGGVLVSAKELHVWDSFPHPKYGFQCANLTIFCSRIGRRIGKLLLRACYPGMIMSFGPLSKLWR